MPAPYLGQCLCGSVSLEATAEPMAILSCFCKHCSLGAGAPNQVIAKFAAKDVQISAADDCFATYALNDTSSGQPKEKVFCKTCGVPLWTVPAAAKGKAIIIRTAILDQSAELRPGCEIFVKNRPAWMSPTEGMPQFEGMRK